MTGDMGPSKGCVQCSLQGEVKAPQIAQPLSGRLPLGSGCQVPKAGAPRLGWASRSVVWLGVTELHVQCDVPQRLLLGHAEEQCLLDVRNVFF